MPPSMKARGSCGNPSFSATAPHRIGSPLDRHKSGVSSGFMLWNWRSHLLMPVRKIKLAALPLALIVVATYFSLNGIYGEGGYLGLAEKREAVRTAERELTGLQAERQLIENEVRLLSGKAISGDLLDEEVRRILNFAHPDEVVVRIPPSAADITSQ